MTFKERLVELAKTAIGADSDTRRMLIGMLETLRDEVLAAAAQLVDAKTTLKANDMETKSLDKKLDEYFMLALNCEKNVTVNRMAICNDRIHQLYNKM